MRKRASTERRKSRLEVTSLAAVDDGAVAFELRRDGS